MSESKEYYSADEVAELLGLHVRTVRRMIHEGRLKAAQVGKQYRVAASELRTLLGTNRGQGHAGVQNRQRRIVAATTVDIDAIGPAEQARLVNLLIAAFHSLDGEQSSRRFDSIYYEEEGRLRLILHADLGVTDVALGLIREALEDKR